MKDYYYILGLKHDCSSEDIKSAYRKLSKKFHPDTNNGDKFFEDRFKEVNEAYEILSNDQKKSTYDNNLKWNSGTSEQWSKEPSVNLILREEVYFVDENIEIKWDSENCQAIEVNIFGKVPHMGSKVIKISKPIDNYKLKITGITGDYICKQEKIISIVSRDQIKRPIKQNSKKDLNSFFIRWNKHFGFLIIMSYILYTLLLVSSYGEDKTVGHLQIPSCIFFLLGLLGFVKKNTIWLIALILQVAVLLGFLILGIGGLLMSILYNVVVILIFYLFYQFSTDD